MSGNTKYRIIPRRIRVSLFETKTVLIVQRLGRGMLYSGWVGDVWYDCDDKDVQDVVLDLFYKQKEK